MKTYIQLVTIISATLAAMSLSGCGKPESGAASKPAAQATSVQKDGPKEGRAIAISGNDTMKFSLTEIRAKPGEALAVTLHNEGTMPKFSMGHNWVLIAEGVDVNAFANDASTAVKTDYVPAAYKDRILAHTKLLGPRESDTAYFKAPTKPGRYTFLCTFPGHFQVGMKGELIVE
ncbi:MAG: azurin [Opitutaceae bacterium]|nr:azurin [Opitutaceae bacterium]